MLKSENLNLLEPSGPVQACNGIDLPLPATYNSNLEMSGQAWKAGHTVYYGNFKRNSQSTAQRMKQRLFERKVWFLGLFRDTNINTGMKPPIINEDT